MTRSVAPFAPIHHRRPARPCLAPSIVEDGGDRRSSRRPRARPARVHRSRGTARATRGRPRATAASRPSSRSSGTTSTSTTCRAVLAGPSPRRASRRTVRSGPGSSSAPKPWRGGACPPALRAGRGTRASPRCLSAPHDQHGHRSRREDAAAWPDRARPGAGGVPRGWRALPRTALRPRGAPADRTVRAGSAPVSARRSCKALSRARRRSIDISWRAVTSANQAAKSGVEPQVGERRDRRGRHRPRGSGRSRSCDVARGVNDRDPARDEVAVLGPRRALDRRRRNRSSALAWRASVDDEHGPAFRHHRRGSEAERRRIHASRGAATGAPRRHAPRRRPPVPVRPPRGDPAPIPCAQVRRRPPRTRPR